MILSEGSSSSVYEEPEPDSEETWIEWWCKRKGNEFLCEIDKEYFDDFNIKDLAKRYDQFERAINIIMDYETEKERDLDDIDMDAEKSAKEQAQSIYGMVH